MHSEAAPISVGALSEAEITVSIRFASAQVTIADLLQWSPGEAIQLDEAIDAPVELIAGGVVIAKGHVLIIDGNYGFEVTELMEQNSSES
jgi:flagellar motor switch protein FliN